MNELTKKAGLKGINANKVKSSMNKYFSTNDMFAKKYTKVKDKKGKIIDELVETATVVVKEKDEDGNETGETREEPKFPICREYPQVYLGSIIETICTRIFTLSLKDAPTNAKDKREINRRCVKRVMRNNKSLHKLFIGAVTEFDKTQSYDNVVCINDKDLQRLLDDDVVLTKKCRTFIKYLVGYLFDNFTAACYHMMIGSKTKSITSTDMRAAANIFIKGSLLTECIKNAETSIQLAMVKDETKTKTKKGKKKTDDDDDDNDNDDDDEDEDDNPKKTSSGKKKTDNDDDDDDDDDVKPKKAKAKGKNKKAVKKGK